MTTTEVQNAPLFDIEPIPRRPHTLTVVTGPQRPGADGTDEPGRTYTITCPGTAAGRCTAWDECQPCTKRAEGDVDFEVALEEDPDHVQHGVEHVEWEGSWVIATKDCWVQHHPDLIEACLAADLTDVGVHLVEWEADDEFLVLREVAA